MNSAPLCKDCQFFIKGRYPRTDSCKRYIVYRGRGKMLYEWTDGARFSESKCGPDAKYFVARQKNESCNREETLRHLLENDE
jgi:hypothetical protein